ncbi:MAG: cation:proton antiporter [Verrucomicrobia bacterium]|nr:cation:proton antiporter [Verrucomicrobiota bacterium]
MDLDLNVSNPVLFIAILTAVALLVPMLFERLRLPGLVGIIIAGMVLGPSGLGIMERNSLIQFLGQAGLLFIVFVAGLEIDLGRFARYRHHSLIFGSISYWVPQIVGALLAKLILGFDWFAAVLLGSMFGSHTLLAYPVASRLGLTRLTSVTASVGGTIITDVSALLVLAIIANTVSGSGDVGFLGPIRFYSSGFFLLIVFRLLPLVARWFYRTVPDEGARDFLFTILLLFLTAWLAQWVGLQPIIGAFFCGIAINKLIPEHSPLMSRIQFVGKTLLVPMFMLSVGMLVSFDSIFGDPGGLLVILVMSSGVVATKFLAALIAGRVLGYSRDESYVLFGMSVNQAAATLAAVVVGYQIGLFSEAVINGAIVMIMVTCFIGPWVTERYGLRLIKEGRLDASPLPYNEQRILVPLANPATVAPLMDLAMMLRNRSSRQPVFPLAVVTEGADTETQLTNAAKLLTRASARIAAANVPTSPVTRVDVNIAEGIRRAVAEHQISTLVLGWSGPVLFAHKIFGNVVDQVLMQTRQTTVVARINESLNTKSRLVVILPAQAIKEGSFNNSIG